MIEGVPSDVKSGNYMILDKTSEQRLGSLQLGTQWELTYFKEHSFKIVGLSYGIKSFTTMPLAFISYNKLRSLLTDIGLENQTTFIIVKLKNHNRLKEVIQYLRDVMKDNDVMTKEEFIHRTVMYWTVQTGIGMAFFLTAILAISIGAAIVGQSIYTSTLEHFREYGTLKAIGARNQDIYKVIFSQATISAVLAYGLALAVVLSVKGRTEKIGVPLYLCSTLFIIQFMLTLITCLASAYFSIKKIKHLDPMTVFKS